MFIRKVASTLTSSQRCLVSSLGVHPSRNASDTPRRAILYIPGNDEKKLLKIEKVDADCAVMDCEDGVALNRKVIILIICHKKSLV